jgi:hypothetical protein
MEVAQLGKGHHRGVNAHKQFNLNFAGGLKIAHQFVLVSRDAASVLQREDLVIIEDTHKALKG